MHLAVLGDKLLAMAWVDPVLRVGAEIGLDHHGCCVSSLIPRELGIRKGGGAKRIVRFWGGGGGKRTIKHPLQNQFWRPQWDLFVWSVPVSSKENDIA